MATDLLSNQDNINQYLLNNPLIKFCKDNIQTKSPFQISCLTLIEVNKMISELKNKNQLGLIIYLSNYNLKFPFPSSYVL